jgi:hypothetical protein
MVDGMNTVACVDNSTVDHRFGHGEIVRTMIHRENEVINHRVTWLTTVQALLFAALSIAWDKPGVRGYCILLCALGISMSVISLIVLTSASLAMKRLWEWWDAHKPSDYDGPDVIGLRPPEWKLLHYFGPWCFMPISFTAAWAIVLWLRT